jgi:hypothetical protein
MRYVAGSKNFEIFQLTKYAGAAVVPPFLIAGVLLVVKVATGVVAPQSVTLARQIRTMGMRPVGQVVPFASRQGSKRPMTLGLSPTVGGRK